MGLFSSNSAFLISLKNLIVVVFIIVLSEIYECTIL